MITLTLTRRRVILLGAAFALVSALSVGAMVVGLTNQARASHLHSDVPTSNFFHDEISWLVDNNIANGFADGTFDPNGFIKRQQAALWFANNNANITTHTSSFDPPNPGTEIGLGPSCPAGKRPIAGGGFTSTAGLYMTATYPVNNRWNVKWSTLDDTPIDIGEVTAYVICVPDNP